jgi:hypothetical protein
MEIGPIIKSVVFEPVESENENELTELETEFESNIQHSELVTAEYAVTTHADA